MFLTPPPDKDVITFIRFSKHFTKINSEAFREPYLIILEIMALGKSDDQFLLYLRTKKIF